ncbi:MAG TPA: 4Fe-4S dicluster domain-containing protein [Gammaproteobacteria bacterium]|nr:4Fe-4S dicluster domain-containing protein [Gammaproteobacteria bacterium]
MKLGFVTTLYIMMPVLLIGFYYIYVKRKEKRVVATLEEARQAGLTEPASLHPLIDENQCVGCAACVTACPEGTILGLVRGKAQLIEPTKCIGHGACARACPFQAITLVFGTAKRGVDIPHVDSNFETNIPGLFIAGELGGMGLIRNAVEQGRQAMEAVAKKLAGMKHGGEHDVIIIGAGPAGFAASLAAHEKKIRYLTIEQDSLGGTVYKFPRGKLVMTAPVKLPMVGKVKFRETRKEILLKFWNEVEKRTGVKIRYREKMEDIQREDGFYRVVTTRGEYTAGCVLLAIGRRGTPRKLGVPGEDVPKVVYSLIDPEQYRNQHVLVVGGGDSALEAATSIAEEPGTTVSISYRSASFSRAKPKNRDKVEAAEKAGRLQVLLSSNVKEIREKEVDIDVDGKLITIPNDAMIVCAGGILPTPFLKKIGIEVETRHGTA